MATLVGRDTSGTYVRSSEWPEVERTRTAKRWRMPDLPDGRRQFAVGCGIGPVHYRADPFSEHLFQEIDLDVVLTPGQDWDAACETNGYQVRFWQNRVVAGQTIRYIAQFRRAGRWFALAPVVLCWINSAGQRSVVSRPVPGIVPTIDNDTYQVTWYNCFGAGIHYRYNLRPDQFLKTVVFDTAASIPKPPANMVGTAGLRLALLLTVSWDGLAKPVTTSNFCAAATIGDLDITEDMLDQGPDEAMVNPGAFAHFDERGPLWWQQKPMAWDSHVDEDGREDPRSVPLSVRWKRKGGSVYVVLAITAVDLQKAVFPVFMDTVMTEEQVAASADDAANYGTTWPGDGNYSATGTTIGLGGYNAGSTSTYLIAGTRFTPPLPQACTIDGAWWSLYGLVTANALRVYIGAEDVDNAAAFAANTHEPYDSYLARTIALYDWNVATTAWSGSEWVGGDGQTTENDLTSVIQEIVDRASWVSGNGLILVSWNTTTVGQYSYENRSRNFRSYDNTTNPANTWGAKFNCTYTEGGATAAATQAEQWDLANLAALSPAQQWNLANLGAGSVAGQWTLANLAALSAAELWTLAALSGASAAEQWNLAVLAPAMIAEQWAIAGLAPATVAEQWQLAQLAAFATAEQWAIATLGAGQVAEQWNLANLAAFSAAEQWELVEAVAQAIAEQWTLGEEAAAVAATLAVQWMLAQLAAGTLPEQWGIEQLIWRARMVDATSRLRLRDETNAVRLLDTTARRRLKDEP